MELEIGQSENQQPNYLTSMRFGNIITIEKKEYWVNGEPLNEYWATLTNKPIILGLSSSPLDKGYFAKWELIENKLFLIDFYGGHALLAQYSYKFQDYFKTSEQPYFAKWFSGILRIQEGRIIYRDHHFGDTKEYSFKLTFKKGVLIKTEMEDVF